MLPSSSWAVFMLVDSTHFGRGVMMEEEYEFSSKLIKVPSFRLHFYHSV